MISQNHLPQGNDEEPIPGLDVLVGNAIVDADWFSNAITSEPVHMWCLVGFLMFANKLILNVARQRKGCA
jgi:hypothetical protein